MPVIPDEGADFEQPPLGTHLAVCVRIVDLGTQENTYQGETTKTHQIAIFWETTQEFTAKGEPFQVVRYYTWSMNPKSNLRKDLESWRGKAFTKEEFGTFKIQNVLGAACQIMIGESQTGKAKVTGVAGWPKGLAKPKPSYEPFMVWLSADEFEEEAFDALSDYWRDKIKASPEWAALHAPKPTRQPGGMSGEHIAQREMGLSADFEDEIPFAHCWAIL